MPNRNDRVTIYLTPENRRNVEEECDRLTAIEGTRCPLARVVNWSLAETLPHKAGGSYAPPITARKPKSIKRNRIRAAIMTAAGGLTPLLAALNI